MEIDPTEQRILGVLIEKEFAVPESYPLTENSLLAGCNQKSNRDPVLTLEDFQLSGALQSMQEKGLVLRVSQAGSRAVRYKHLVEEKLNLNDREKAVLAELLVRGPQAPGALKARVARMGMAASPPEILVVLEGLRARADGSLVVQQPRLPRERDQRWAHLLGESAVASQTEMSTPEPGSPPPESTSPPVATSPVSPPPLPDELGVRVTRLEREVAELRAELARLRGGSGHADGT